MKPQSLSICDKLSARYRHRVRPGPQSPGSGRGADRRCRRGKICTSIIVACELRYGAAKKGSTRLAAQVDAVLDVIRILNFEPDADQRYGTLRTQLETAGTVIGASDMLIAAHALSIGATLVTDNEREFSRVKGLHLENWLRPAEGGQRK